MRASEAVTEAPRLFGALRVRHWAHFLALPLASVEARVGYGPAMLAAARGVTIAFSVLAFGYLLNSVSDRSMDHSVAKNPLVGRSVVGAQVYALLFTFAAMALGLAITAPLPVVVATSACLGSGIVYSVGPRLKRLPVVGTFLNVTNFAPLLWMGLMTAHGPAGLSALTLAFAALLLQNQLFHEAADRHDDARGRVVTTVRAFGVTAAAGTALLLGFGTAAVAALYEASVLVIPFVAVFGLAFPLVLARRGDDVLWMARARGYHRISSVVAGALLFASLRTSW